MIECRVGSGHGRAVVEVRVRDDRRISVDVVGYEQHFCVDENHASALILALQAAVAEIQARAVSR